jgi:hypothetical protein
MPGVITRPAFEKVDFFRVFALACAEVKLLITSSEARTEAIDLICLRECISGRFSGPIYPSNRGDVTIRMGANFQLFNEMDKSNHSSQTNSCVQA